MSQGHSRPNWAQATQNSKIAVFAVIVTFKNGSWERESFKYKNVKRTRKIKEIAKKEKTQETEREWEENAEVVCTN